MTERESVQSASILRDARVLNTDGEMLGHMRDFVLDLDHGRIAYALVSTAPAADTESRLLRVVPWELVHIDKENGSLVLDVLRDQIESAPSFDGDERPDLSDPHFQETVYSHYGYMSGIAA